ncbi:protein POLAR LOCALIZATION DURING ASYMMETRIC DIVISION AND REDISTRIBUTION isoform X2 [Juglans microcarpa x Juglans regia]|uniref:protein POLAR LOCALIZATION DURING ASYMMETRIC DIVISION AND REDISTRIBUTION isoform X2 n=1 Tax=Juglans microcarpa x Juglans regia TaxID=2249226 RepID=UPI001B7E7E8D|nr:protein POLAR LOCALIZATION DURING ASYMMETRIC DIVISION AND REDISTRIBUTION isoform X2 [Juglans microcarpa x Juglans regia]
MKSLFFNDLSFSLSPVKSDSQRLRIADILADEGEDSDLDFGMDRWRRNDGSTNLQCSSPRRVVARWLAALRRIKETRNIMVQGQKTAEEEEEDERQVRKFAGGSIHAKRSMNGLDVVDSSPLATESEESGRCRKDASFNLGVGCSLLYLIAASKNELTKMVEVRKQVETLLLNVKEELKRKDAEFKAFESNFTVAYSTSDVLESPNSNSRVSRQSQTTSHVLPISETILMHDQPLKCNSLQQEEYLEGMDGLEAELEAELERLQIHLERENSLKHTQQRKTKVTVKDIASVRSPSLSFGEVIDTQNPGTKVHFGVQPTELESRLHELLEARQQERIKELEAALECAMHKLREKETEVSWWKGTARFISQHVPGPSRFVSQHATETS